MAEAFEIAIPQARLDWIAARLALSQPGYAPADDAGWNYGTDARWLGRLLEYWREEYDWRRCERQLNALPNYRAAIDGVLIHFLHVRGTGERRGCPILLTHGWPGSIVEFMEVVEPLTAMGFDVVIPSLPGYAFSGRPDRVMGPREVAGLWRKLMVEVLGYPRFFAQGGDWGSAVTAALGHDHADVVAAIHLNLFMALPPSADDDEDTRGYRLRVGEVQASASAYMMEHATKPQTIGLALADSPIGFASWVCEKFHGWSDPARDFEQRFTMDQLLDNLMVHLVNDAVQSAIWMYRSIFTEERASGRIAVPTGLALYPGEFLPYPPRSAAERAFNVADWQVMPSGGHFAAMEQPAAFARNVGGFFAAQG